MNRKGKKSQNRGHLLFEVEDFLRLKLGAIMSEHTEGIAVHFLKNVKPVLSWSPPVPFIYLLLF